MTRDDIIRMAREAGLADGIELDREIAEFERFANLVAAAEREACVEALKQVKDKSGVNTDGQAWLQRASRSDFIAAIQARGQE